MWSRYVALGDSFTEGLMDVTGPEGRHRGWADRFACALAAQNPDLRYANLAVRGRLLPQVTSEQVPVALRLQPDLVSLAAGVNDVLRRSYDLHANATALENAVIALRSSGADVVLFAFGDPARRSRLMASVRDRMLVFNSATRAIASRYGCSVVDFWGVAAFDGDEMWDEDRLHLSPAGHALAAAAALEAVGVGDDAWRTPQPVAALPAIPGRAIGHVRWAGRHFGPWALRRIQGRTSGDLVTAKLPHLVAPVCH